MKIKFALSRIVVVPGNLKVLFKKKLHYNKRKKIFLNILIRSEINSRSHKSIHSLRKLQFGNNFQ